MTLTLRRFESTDTAQVLDRMLAKRWINDYLSRSPRYRMAAVLGLCAHRFYVLENSESGRIVGTVTLRKRADRYLLGFDWWIAGLRVIPEHRRQGLGTKLVDLALAELRRLGAKKVFVHLVPQDGPVSRRLFAGNNFEFVNSTFTFTKDFFAPLPRTNRTKPILMLRHQEEIGLPFQILDRKAVGQSSAFLSCLRRVLSSLGLLRTEFSGCHGRNGVTQALIIRYFFLRIKVELYVSDSRDAEFLASAVSAYFALFRLCRLRKMTVDVHCADPSCANLTLALLGAKAYDRQDLMVHYLR